MDDFAFGEVTGLDFINDNKEDEEQIEKVSEFDFERIIALFRVANEFHRVSDFCDAYSEMLRIFDTLLGSVFTFVPTVTNPRISVVMEAIGDNESMRLDEVIDTAGVREYAHEVHVNLRWLCRGIHFLEQMMDKMIEDPELELANAVWESYTVALKPYDPYIVAGTVYTGTFLMPYRESFLARMIPFADKDVGDDSQTVETVRSFKDTLAKLSSFQSELKKMHSYLIDNRIVTEED